MGKYARRQLLLSSHVGEGFDRDNLYMGVMPVLDALCERQSELLGFEIFNLYTSV
jgi:hypothetical protein